MNLYKKFGYEKLLSFIDGDVQILIYDSEKEKIFFNNSKFGVMPCYFYGDNNEILFSNNLKELAHIKDSYELDNKYDCLLSANNLQENVFYKGIPVHDTKFLTFIYNASYCNTWHYIALWVIRLHACHCIIHQHLHRCKQVSLKTCASHCKRWPKPCGHTRQ